jgi:hypothetical protein
VISIPIAPFNSPKEENGMSRKTKHEVVCRSQADFEKVFLPSTYEKMLRKKAMEDPRKFGEHLEEELKRRIRMK